MPAIRDSANPKVWFKIDQDLTDTLLMPLTYRDAAGEK